MPILSKSWPNVKLLLLNVIRIGSVSKFILQSSSGKPKENCYWATLRYFYLFLNCFAAPNMTMNQTLEEMNLVNTGYLIHLRYWTGYPISMCTIQVKRCTGPIKVMGCNKTNPKSGSYCLPNLQPVLKYFRVTNSRIPRLIKHWIEIENHINNIIRYRIDIGYHKSSVFPSISLHHYLNADYRFAWAKTQGMYWKTNTLTSNSLSAFQCTTSRTFAYKIR